MPSSRRLKYLLALVALTFVVILYYSSDSSHTQDAEFYKKTKLALEKATEDKRLKADADMQLEKILKNAKDLASGEKVAKILKTSALPDTVPPGEEQKKIPPAPPGTDEEVDE